MRHNGWRLLFHHGLVEQLRKVRRARDRAKRPDSGRRASNANAKLFDALARVMLETMPEDPSRRAYRQGSTLGEQYRHWRRAKIGRRFRLFFRYDSTAKMIVHVRANDEHTLRAAGSKTDPCAVFRRMLARGNPPDDRDALVNRSLASWPTEE